MRSGRGYGGVGGAASREKVEGGQGNRRVNLGANVSPYFGVRCWRGMVFWGLPVTAVWAVGYGESPKMGFAPGLG
jgi:hypothetical protein